MFNRRLTLLCTITAVLFVQSASAETLEDAVTLGLKYHPTLKADRATIDSADETVKTTRSNLYPTLAVTGEVNVDRYVRQYGPMNLQGRDVGIYLNQLLFDGFSTQAQVRTREAEKTALEKDRARNANTVAFAVARAYVRLLRERELLLKTQHNLDEHRRTESLLSAIVKHDPGRSFDLEQVRTRRVFAESLRQEQLTSLNQADGVYREYLGHNARELSPAFFETVTPLFTDLTTLDDALHVAETSHPAILGAAARSESAQAAWEAQFGKYWPKVTASARYVNGYDRQAVPGFNSEAYVGVQASYTYGEPNFARDREAKASWDAADKRIAAIRRDVRESVRTAWYQLAGVRANKEPSYQAMQKAHEVLEGFKTQYMFGRRTALELLIVQNEAYLTDVRATNVRYDEVLAELFLLAQIGVLADRIAPPPKPS